MRNSWNHFLAILSFKKEINWACTTDPVEDRSGSTVESLKLTGLLLRRLFAFVKLITSGQTTLIAMHNITRLAVTYPVTKQLLTLDVRGNEDKDYLVKDHGFKTQFDAWPVFATDFFRLWPYDIDVAPYAAELDAQSIFAPNISIVPPEPLFAICSAYEVFAYHEEPQGGRKKGTATSVTNSNFRHFLAGRFWRALLGMFPPHFWPKKFKL